MIIKNIQLKNFQSYTEYQADFSNLTLIQGKNGSGKTTLGLDAILFAIYGYTKKTLADLPRKGTSKCLVTIEVNHKGDNYVITRTYPTSITVECNGENLKFATGAEAQRYLADLFGDVNYFKRFRMIDNDVGINFLEEGPQTLKKILFSVSDELFNKVKDNLNNIKRQRELYNKDKAVVHKHFPSEKRLEVLKKGINALNSEKTKADTEVNSRQRELRLINSDLSSYNTSKKQMMISLEDLEINEECYACHKSLEEELSNKMIKDLENKIKDLDTKIEEKEKLYKTANDTMERLQKEAQKFSPRITKLNNLKFKLETRIKQIDYKYTTKDVEIAKKALLEVDSLSTKCLIRSIKVLEPIINSVLEKIQFRVNFDLNTKGKLSIDLFREEDKFNYKDLSAGQKLLLQIAFKLALLLEKNEEGVIIADEGFSSLDRDNLIHVLNIFEHYPFQLLFILHGFSEVPGGIKVINIKEKKKELQNV